MSSYSSSHTLVSALTWADFKTSITWTLLAFHICFWSLSCIKWTQAPLHWSIWISEAVFITLFFFSGNLRPILDCKNISEVQPPKKDLSVTEIHHIQHTVLLAKQLSADLVTEYRAYCLEGQANRPEDSRSLTVNILWINLTAIWIPVCVLNTNMWILKQQGSSCEHHSDKSAKEGRTVWCTAHCQQCQSGNCVI